MQLELLWPVQDSEWLTTESDFVSAVVGTSISLRCRASGRPTPLYDWRREGRIIQSRNRFEIQAGTLQISAVQATDAGRYDCVAENVLGRATKSIFLQVHGGGSSRRGDEFVASASQQARQRVSQAVNTTLTQLFDRSRTHSVSDLLTAFRYPSPDAVSLAQAEEVFETTLEIIYQKVNEGHNFDLDEEEVPITELVSPAHLRSIANMSGCLMWNHRPDCSDQCFHKRYRTLDGSCNNLANPDWGAANSAFNRLLPPIYENGFNQPVGWSQHRLYRGTHLPSPRLVSSLLMSTDQITNDDQFTHFLMQWGQFVDHDMDLGPQAVSYARFSDGRRCNDTCERSNPCFPIPVPRSDTRVGDRQCMGFTRTSATCNSGSTSLFFSTVQPRQQLNALTSFIDASNVYGNTNAAARELRDLASNRGLLRTGPVSTGNKRLLPFDDDTLHHIDCQLEPEKSHVPCFRAGDPRANEQLALTATHTLWLRQHNNMARQMHRINPHWDGNKIFYETRKIVGAMMQHITYDHWLPKILGPRGMEMMGNYTGYDQSVNPSIVNEFAVAALRFGHTLVQPVIFRLNESFQEIPEGNLPLHKAFFAPYRLLEEGGIDPLLRGLFGRAAKKRMPGEFFNSELTERLFRLANAIGQDLASLNIQRGRDHGIQFYNDYRVYCGLHRARNFEDLRNEIQHRDTRDKLQALYGHPDNIDLFIGGLSETLVPSAKVGPTFLCILADQFKRIRDGDRFWYEREGVFEPDQLVAIKRSTLASVLCESSDSITRVQEDVFLRAESDQDYKECTEIPQIDVRQWTDCCEDCRQRATVTSFATPARARIGGLGRRRRSAENMEFSYAHERPLDFNPNTNMSLTTFQEEVFENEVVTEEETKISSDTEDVKSKQKQDLIEEKLSLLTSTEKADAELMDTRVEGLEEAVMDMHKLIVSLRQEIKDLQHDIPPRKRSCKDEQGQRRRHGERWKLDGCSKCVCKRGQIECRSRGC